MDSGPRVVIYSHWCNDIPNRLDQRVTSLLDKSYPNRRYLWNVCDSSDDTAWFLRQRAASADVDITVVERETGLENSDAVARLKRLSATMTHGFKEILESDDLLIFHESDLVSPYDLIERMLSDISPTAVMDVVVGTFPYCPSVAHTGDHPFFFDTWGCLPEGSGLMFANTYPYWKHFQWSRTLKMHTVGSCWLTPTWFAKDLHIERLACIEMSRKAASQGLPIVMNTSIRVAQDPDLVTSWPHCPVSKEDLK